jgi:hypothetical protein
MRLHYKTISDPQVERHVLMFTVTNAEFNLLTTVTIAINVDATINLNLTYVKLTISIGP